MNAPMTTGPREARVPVAKLPLRQVKDVRELLVNDTAKQQLSAVAAKHMNPERMMRVIANAIRTTPQLADCDPMSLLGALMTCASLGLEPNTPLGHAYLIPFKNNKKGITEVQLIIGYKGYLDLARRTGQVKNIHADVVYDDDELWSYEFGTDRHLRHKPGPRKGNKTHAYCYIALEDGDAFVVIPWDVVIATREASQGWQTAKRFGKTAQSPWMKHEDPMGRKTAIRAMANGGEMPLSIEFMQAIESDDSAAQFSAFALNPQDGLVIDGSAEGADYDQETGEVHQVEDQRAGQMMMDDQRAPEPVQQSRQRSNARAADHTDKTPYDERPKRQAKPAQEEQQKGMFEPDMGDMLRKVDEQVRECLMDGADLAETIELFEAQIEAFRKSIPDELAAMMDEWKAFIAERDGE